MLAFLIVLKQKVHTKGNLLKAFFIPKLLNNPPAPYSLINLKFLLTNTLHFDESIVFFLLHLFQFWICTFSIFPILQKL